VVFAARGASSTDPTPAGQSKVDFTDQTFKAEAKPQVTFDTPTELYAGFPSTLKIKVENVSSGMIPSTRFTLSNQKLELNGIKEFETPVIPPFGYVAYNYDARSQSLLQSFDDNLQVQFGSITFNKKIVVKPFFAHTYFALIALGLTFMTIGLYIWLVILHAKAPKRFHLKVHKEVPEVK
jgi:hypothetical protein